MENPNMAQIPYIEHKYRMYLADKRESRLKLLLILTNAAWFLASVIYFMR